MEVKQTIEKFLEKRPDTICAFGYDLGKQEKLPINLILAVNDMKAWHLENMKENPSDYSFTGRVFYSKASKEKIKGFNGITYQSNIEENSRLFSYGVIELKDLEYQLRTWNRVSLVGTFHKSILTIKSNQEMDLVIEQNRQEALITALYFLEDSSTLTELYEKIVFLSSIGNTRNNHESKTIISKQKSEFDRIYLKENPFFQTKGEEITIHRNIVEKAFLPAYLAYDLSDISKEDLKKVREGIIQFLKGKKKEEARKQAIHEMYIGNYTFQKEKKMMYKK
jgi:hypothetical protein